MPRKKLEDIQPDPNTFLPSDSIFDIYDDRDDSEFSEYFRFVKGKVSVNWEEIYDMRNSKGEDRELYHIILKQLVALDVLSYSRKGNFTSFLENKSTNPTISGRHVYFTREEDFIKYQRLIFADENSRISEEKEKPENP